MAISAVSLFCGGGGSDVGLSSIGIDVVWASDIWATACEIYKHNADQTEVVCQDIRTIRNFPTCNLMVGCYPCQGFSQAGLRNPDHDLNKLYLEFGRGLEASRPKAFIVENVAGMTYGRNRELLEAQLSLFRSVGLGYDVSWQVLDARNYGLAQERKRIFIVGTRTDLAFGYTFPEPTHGPLTPQPWTSQREVIGEFPEWPEFGVDTQPFSWYYLSRPRRRDWESTAPCVVGHSRSVALHPVSPALEYVGKDAYKFATAEPARRYSYLECAALQGFPLDYNWGSASTAAKYKVIGNSVPPPLMAAVAAPLVELLR